MTTDQRPSSRVAVKGLSLDFLGGTLEMIVDDRNFDFAKHRAYQNTHVHEEDGCITTTTRIDGIDLGNCEIKREFRDDAAKARYEAREAAAAVEQAAREAEEQREQEREAIAEREAEANGSIVFILAEHTWDGTFILDDACFHTRAEAEAYLKAHKDAARFAIDTLKFPSPNK